MSVPTARNPGPPASTAVSRPSWTAASGPARVTRSGPRRPRSLPSRAGQVRVAVVTDRDDPTRGSRRNGGRAEVVEGGLIRAGRPAGAIGRETHAAARRPSGATPTATKPSARAAMAVGWAGPSGGPEAEVQVSPSTDVHAQMPPSTDVHAAPRPMIATLLVPAARRAVRAAPLGPGRAWPTQVAQLLLVDATALRTRRRRTDPGRRRPRGSRNPWAGQPSGQGSSG